MSLDSGRDVEGSVDGGVKLSSAAGVLGFRESRWMSVVWIGGLGISRVSRTGRRESAKRDPLDLEEGFLGSSLLRVEGRCFLGDRTGSVLTGSWGN